ncbi:MAG: TraR/DksA family transcriptional regulator [Acidobacteriota bacterium]|nr:MAG: TraR/DksA family transcriptional regulator [Acidobacteriota bacterium]
MKKKVKAKKKKTAPKAGAGKKTQARTKTKNKKKTPAKAAKSRPKRLSKPKPLRSSSRRTSAAGRKKPLVAATSPRRRAPKRREHAAAGQVPEKLDRKMRKDLRNVLEAKRREIVEAYQHAKQSSFEEDEIYGTHDIGDMAASSYAREFFLTLSGSERALLLQIEAAIQRMDKHKYGVCEICRKRIDPARLLAIPWATHCVPCQVEAEGN